MVTKRTDYTAEAVEAAGEALITEEGVCYTMGEGLSHF